MKIIMTKGLPGSGKSTWAREMLRKHPGQFKRINKDELRSMLDDGKWSKANEHLIVLLRDTIALSALEHGFSVIVDDTNLHPKHELQLREMAKIKKAEFEIKDFTDVPLETCIKQDLLRYSSVGEKVIMKHYNQFLRPKAEKPEVDLNLPSAILCDIDGTLALFGDANPYDRDFLKDEVNEAIADILEAYADAKKVKIILVSGRNNKYKEHTEAWLLNHGIPYDLILMPRNPDDQRKDFILKKEVYDAEIKGKYNVLFVLDDRNQVVDLWRGLGLTCLQVAEGDF